jgi:hypothetical protein
MFSFYSALINTGFNVWLMPQAQLAAHAMDLLGNISGRSRLCGFGDD